MHIALVALVLFQGPQMNTRLRGLDAIEVYLVSVPKEYAGQPDIPAAAYLREVVDHRLAADKVPTASFLAVANDPDKLETYQAKKKGHLMVEVELVASGGAFAYNVTAQVVEDAKIVRTGAAILAPIWSKSTIGVAGSTHLKAAIRNEIVDDIDDLAADLAQATGK